MIQCAAWYLSQVKYVVRKCFEALVRPSEPRKQPEPEKEMFSFGGTTKDSKIECCRGGEKRTNFSAVLKTLLVAVEQMQAGREMEESRYPIIGLLTRKHFVVTRGLIASEKHFFRQ
jgi:hypothetical protein